MKKKKLQLKSLEVNSFTTRLSESEQRDANGGTGDPVVISYVISYVISQSVAQTTTPPPPKTTDPMATPCPVTPIVTRADLATCNNGPNC